LRHDIPTSRHPVAEEIPDVDFYWLSRRNKTASHVWNRDIHRERYNSPELMRTVIGPDDEARPIWASKSSRK
jgi:hypothetical protein